MALSGFEQMMAGLGSLSKSMKEFATTRATSQAQDEINNLNSSEMDEMDKRNKLSAVAQNLTLRLSGLGVDPTQVAQIGGAIKPAAISSAEDAYAAAAATKDPKLAKTATNWQDFSNKSKMDLQRLDNQGKLDVANANNAASGEKGFGKEFSKLADDVNPNRARAGVMGDLQKRINAAGRVEALFTASKGNPNNIGMRELSTSVASMITMGSQTAVQQINELVPHSAVGKANEIAQWYKNEPTGLEQQAFANQFLKISQREKSVSSDQLKLGQLQTIAGKAHLERENPAMFQQLLKARGLDYNDYTHVMTNGTLPDRSVKMKGPDGKTYNVKSSDVAAAIAAGGQEL